MFDAEANNKAFNIAQTWFFSPQRLITLKRCWKGYLILTFYLDRVLTWIKIKPIFNLTLITGTQRNRPCHIRHTCGVTIGSRKWFPSRIPIKQRVHGIISKSNTSDKHFAYLKKRKTLHTHKHILFMTGLKNFWRKKSSRIIALLHKAMYRYYKEINYKSFLSRISRHYFKACSIKSESNTV